MVGDDDQDVVKIRLSRLGPALAANIRRTAKDGNRTLPMEILGRLKDRAAASGEPDLPLIYGWSNPERVKALADLLGTLAADIIDEVADIGDQAAALGLVNIAIANLLAGLGAKPDLPEPQVTAAKVFAQGTLKGLERVEPTPDAYNQRPALAVLARFKQAWTFSPADGGKEK